MEGLKLLGPGAVEVAEDGLGRKSPDRYGGIETSDFSDYTSSDLFRRKSPDRYGGIETLLLLFFCHVESIAGGGRKSPDQYGGIETSRRANRKASAHFHPPVGKALIGMEGLRLNSNRSRCNDTFGRKALIGMEGLRPRPCGPSSAGTATVGKALIGMEGLRR